MDQEILTVFFYDVR